MRGLKVAVAIALLFYFTANSASGFLHSKSTDLMSSQKLVLGSRPPRCFNRCSKCSPCMATLVVPSHQKRRPNNKADSYGDNDNNYYLLSWKCQCGNKFFQP